MSDARSRGAGLWLTLLLGALVLLNYVDRGAVGIAAPKLKDELMLSATAFGIAVSAFSWVYAPAQFAVGWLSDRFCVYRLIAAGLAIWALATFLTGFATGLAMLIGLRVMLGIGEGVAFPAASKIIARHVAAERRGIANATLAAALAWGPALGTFAGGLILNYYGWRPIFIVFGSVTLLWIVPWLLVSKPQWSRFEKGSGHDVGVGQVMRNRTVWAMGIGHICNTYGFYFLLAWLPLFLIKVRGLSILEMTAMMTSSYVLQGFAALWLGLAVRPAGPGRLGRGPAAQGAAQPVPAGVGRRDHRDRLFERSIGDLRLATVRGVVRRHWRYQSLCDRADLRRARSRGDLGRGDERGRQPLRNRRPGAHRNPYPADRILRVRLPRVGGDRRFRRGLVVVRLAARPAAPARRPDREAAARARVIGKK